MRIRALLRLDQVSGIGSGSGSDAQAQWAERMAACFLLLVFLAFSELATATFHVASLWRHFNSDCAAPKIPCHSSVLYGSSPRSGSFPGMRW